MGSRRLRGDALDGFTLGFGLSTGQDWMSISVGPFRCNYCRAICDAVFLVRATTRDSKVGFFPERMMRNHAAQGLYSGVGDK